MEFAKNVWKLLVAIKDGLALLFLLLFFALLFAILTARPGPAGIKDGALMMNLDGFIVEERAPIDPFAALFSAQAPTGEHDVQEVIHALETAAEDDRINSVVLDLRGFLGAGAVHLREVGEALDKVRAADKPVLAYGTAYTDDGIRLAAHASEVWLDPLGGAVIAGTGGNRLYYGELLDKLGVNARVFKVGTYKSAVEPFLGNSMSEPARENAQALYGELWDEWQARVKKARPQIEIERVAQTPAAWVASTNGDLAEAAKDAGLVDELGSWTDFGTRVAEIAGEDTGDTSPGAFAHTELKNWLADNPFDEVGDVIGVVTIAGEIVDGDAGPGTAGGDRIAKLLDDALDDDLKGLVVRVDSPGGSVLASEMIREAILRHKAKDIPVAVSMANVAASGGYWVSTPADRIFAEPETITGSIGIFAVLPTFERLADNIGVSADGVTTTPLSGQPDFIGGFNSETEQILQASIENGYDRFVRLVAESRGRTPAQIDAIGQGRVWDGGTARQNGLVDQFGDLDTALAWVAEQAGLEDGDWHARYLGSGEDEYQTLLRQLLTGDDAQTGGGDLFAVTARREAQTPARVARDMQRLLETPGMRAYCLGCPEQAGAIRGAAPGADAHWLSMVARVFGD
ncbi:signal peptide peptidase SppA [Alteriqipengyuania lutimaris]|uniref:Signal peptide peptidase SppA n=1 Tax=Alteriqipengyuania lutimaris TaxID=1538146 RepID=A0A395LKV7_9SPHN|nr:signal peptide peptidase SppA [Alteriqipengyuania lutimaris]MBB3033530.1 protease-4 [Alteriqipengyuania lutimaris]RDS77461.1 signal peptide peptidase SppA [Alteriqipengyuania lutimaris]